MIECDGSVRSTEAAGGARPPQGPEPSKPAVAVALAAFVACCWLRTDIAVALVALGAVWTVLEWSRPVHRQPAAFRRTGATTDMAHFVIDEILAAAGLAAVVVVSLPFVEAAVPDVIPRVMQSGPGWLTWALGLVLAEVFGYWGHRLEHEIPLLWRFHRVHHSSTTMDWLAPNRRHPIDMTFSRVSVALPMFALGFGLPVLVGAFLVKRFQGLFVHANWNVRLGPLEWVFATPHSHHWHHADDPAAYNTNYAGQSMLVDKVFGTLHRPAGWPEAYGADGYTPDRGYLAQLASPWHPDNVRPSPRVLDAHARARGTGPSPTESHSAAHRLVR
jgi:sterol desaturase/sphingolipid hydroxylase (fatty acid hydroxylase superfamily)